MKKRVAIVVPCYNEEESLPHLIAVLEKVRGKLNSYIVDFLFINDGSTDRTQRLLIDLAAQHSYVGYREFAYNAGHQSALRAGLNGAAGYDAAIMLDADLQHPPELIPTMLKHWEKGARLVQMIRDDGPNEAGLLKYLTSKAYYRLINFLSDLNLEYGASDFRLIDREVIDVIAKSREQDLFLRGYFSWLNVPKVSIVYKPNQRVAGSSKYTFRKMLDLAMKGILQFSEKPLRIAVSLGVLMAVSAFLYSVVLVVRYMLGSSAVSGWTSLMLVVLFFFGITFILLGIIGSYLAHLIRLEKQRPEYIIASEVLPTR